MNVQCVRYLLLLASIGYAVAQWTPGTYPNPITDTDKCGRQGVKSWVCDPDGVISYSDANVVEGIIKDIARAEKPYAKSPCGSKDKPGFEIAVALMKEMDMSKTDPQAFAEALHNSWGVGHSECDDGVLLLLATNNKKIYISTGKTAEGKMPNSKAEGIIHEMKPMLSRLQYGEAVKSGVSDIGQVLAKKAWERWLEYLIPGSFLALIAGCFCCGTIKKSKKASAKEKVKMLKEMECAVREDRYECTTCPVCLDEFDKHDHSSSDSDDQANESLIKRRRKEKWEKDAKKSEKKYPLTLPCGHTFCEPCLMEWIDHNSTCPICRENIPSVQDPSFPAGYSTSRARWTSQTYDPEFHYRLNRLHYLYPGYITPGFIDMWYMDYRLGRDFDYRSHADFRRWDAPQQSNWENSGRHGAVGSFGGGGTDGGGGAGGSW